MRAKVKSPKRTKLVLDEFEKNPDTWKYGYELYKDLGIRPIELYPILKMLEKEKILVSKWEPSRKVGKPARKIYKLKTAQAAH